MYHHWHAFPVSFSLSPETPCQLEYRHFVCFFSAFFSMLLCIIGSLVNWAYEEMSPLSRSWICEPLQMVKSQILLLVIVTSHFQLHDPIISARSFTIILSLRPHQETKRQISLGIPVWYRGELWIYLQYGFHSYEISNLEWHIRASYRF